MSAVAAVYADFRSGLSGTIRDNGVIPIAGAAETFQLARENAAF